MDDYNGLIMLVAQDGVTGLPGDGGSAPATGADGSPTSGGGGGGGGPGFDMWLPLLLVLVVGMLVMSTLGQRKERKKRDNLLKAIKKHDRVQTVGGVIGSIVEIKSDTVVLKVDESANTRITFARSSVQQVLSASDDEGGKDLDH